MSDRHLALARSEASYAKSDVRFLVGAEKAYSEARKAERRAQRRFWKSICKSYCR